MRLVLAFCVAFLLGTVIAKAAPLVAEAPFKDFGTPVTVSISTTTWTKIPTTQTSGRSGFYVDDPSAGNANMVGHIGNCTSTSIATTVRPIEIIKGESSVYFPLREDVCLWLLSLHTAAENVHYQEVKQ